MGFLLLPCNRCLTVVFDPTPHIHHKWIRQRAAPIGAPTPFSSANCMQHSVVRLSKWNEARDALRHRDLRQGLYDEGNALMDGVIVNLHGADHLARRR